MKIHLIWGFEPTTLAENRSLSASSKSTHKILKYFNLQSYESVTFKMTHFAFVNKGQIPCVIILILTLIDKCKMCYFEFNELIC
jgi:hypothetical protein